MAGPRLLALAIRALAALAAAGCVRAVGAELVRVQLTPREHAVLAAEIAAKVSRVHVAESEAFQAGDLLVSFEAALPQAQVERARAVLSAAEKTLAANQRLVVLNSVGKVETELAEAEVAKARAELAYALAMLAKCEIRAPFAGRVAEQRIRAQEFTQAGQPLLEIIDDQVPQVDFIAPSKWLAWLAPGQALTVRIDETGGTYTALVERIGARVDPVSQSVRVTAGVAGATAGLVAGMSGTLAAP